MRAKSSFTLIELLVVIAILAILSVVIVLIINPGDLIRQSRDTNRITDINNLNKALGIFRIANPNDFIGTSTIIYVSLPDSNSTCANLGLPALPAGYSYNCAASSTLTKTDGTGWVPINFDAVSYGSPIQRLPIDPQNTTSTGAYYTYIIGGSYQFTTILESNKYKMGGSQDKTSIDNGQYPEIYEIGTDLDLLPVNRSSNLVAYWDFEGTGTSAYDSSGHGNTGTMYSSTTITDIHNSSDCVRGSCAEFDGDNRVSVNSASVLNSTDEMTVTAWVKITATTSQVYGAIISRNGINNWSWLFANNTRIPRLYSRMTDDTYTYKISSNSLTTNQWDFVVFVYKDSDQSVRFYSNGNLGGTGNYSLPMKTTTWNTFLIGSYTPTTYHSIGLMDEVKIYNRALSADEILALYNAR
ncbi:MAG: LamG-like jellyroll fold domain-containing protein [bacterium]|nr:LamG-like jellyroll fold domain-containing protein [bacterium]